MYPIISRVSSCTCRINLISPVSLGYFGKQSLGYFNNSTNLQQQKKHVSFNHHHRRSKLISPQNALTCFSTNSPLSTSSTMNDCIYLTAEKAKECLDNYDTILLDCDGVLWGTDHATKFGNIDKALKKLRDCGKQLLFVTNNSLHSTESFQEKFRSFGYDDVSGDELFSISSATALYLKEVLKIKGSVYLIGTPAMDMELRSVGIDCFGLGPDPDPITRDMDQMLKADIRDDVEAVLVGFDEHINYNKLYKAASYLRRSQGKCHYLATSNVEMGTWIGTGHYRPATGVMVHSVTAACGREPLIIGKPSPFLYDCIEKRFPNIEKHRTIMIGDSLKSDIMFAKNVGIASGLVLSGATDLETLSAVSDDKKPMFYFESVGIFAEAL